MLPNDPATKMQGNLMAQQLPQGMQPQAGMMPMYYPMPMFIPQMAGMMGMPGGIPAYPGFGGAPFQYGMMPQMQAAQEQALSTSASTQKPKSAPQTKEEYIQRFNKEVLPRLTTKRLTKLQAAIRGHYVRRVVLPRMKLYDALLRDYVSRKVDELIEDSIVPDVALEVINENSVKKDMDLYGSKVRGDITYVEGMVDRVVKGLARVVVQETIDGITNQKQEEKIVSNDPVELVAYDYLEAFIRKEVREVVDDSTAELTDLYIIESQYITFFRRKLMKERISKVMSEAIDDLICESFVNAAIERIIEGIAEPLALLCAEEEFFEQESEEIEKGFDQYVMRDILDGLLDTINERLQDKNLEFIADQAMKYNKFKDFTEDFLNDVIMFDDEK